MSEAFLTAAPSPEQQPVSGSSLLRLALAPTVLVIVLVLVLLLHCTLLGYKLLRLARRSKDTRRCSRNALSISCARLRSPTPVTSSLASSAERRLRLLRPDGTTRMGSGSRVSAPVLLLLQSSDSDTERGRVVPPNSPEHLGTSTGALVAQTKPVHGGGMYGGHHERASMPITMMRRSSTMDLELLSLDKVHVEGEIISSILQETSCIIASINSSAAGPGLDSDFGASAGVSLRILSADSDSFPGAPWASGLEWDYYDPSYITQNHIPKHRHHAPPITIKQYWV